MRTRSLAVVVALGVGGCMGSTGTKPSEPAPGKAEPLAGAVPFPPGFDYPLPVEVLEKAVETRDISLLRQHGWYLYAGINQPLANGLSLWRSWPTSTHAFAPPPSAAASVQATRTSHGRSLIQANRDNVPVDLPAPQYPVPAAVCSKYGLPNCPGTAGKYYQLADGVTFQNNGDIMVAGVIYDESAYGWIRGNSGTGSPAIYNGNILTGMLPPSGQTKEIPQFLGRSIVLKHMYWPVPGNACGALPVWDDPVPPTPSTYMGYEVWPRAVAVATPGCKVPPGGTADVSFLHGVQDPNGNPLPPRVFKGARVVPLSNFYSQTLSQANLDALGAQDRAILDASAWWAYGREFRAGDAIVSIATHIFTKEMPSWTMQSFWWHDAPDKGPYASDRPDIPQAPKTWRNYLMVGEYGIPTEVGGSQLPASFNPYIELVSHPVATNCRNCHQRAAWPRGGLNMSPSAQYQLKDGDPGLLTLLKADDPIFKSLLLLDFQWAVSDRALVSSQVSPGR